MKAIARIVFGAGLATAIASLTACTVTRKPDGTIEVRESTNPATDGVYTRVNIGGRCYLSNGNYCIPCGGGKALPCEDVRRVLGDTPWTEPQAMAGTGLAALQNMLNIGDGGGESNPPHGEPPDLSELAPSATMLWSVNALTNGLNAAEVSESLGLDDWQPGALHSTVFSVNSFDSDAETVDFTYITAWGASAPSPGTYSNGVTVEYYFLGGDLTDNIRDAVAIRVSGPWDAVADAAVNIGSFHGQIATDYGQFAISFGAESNTIKWNGTTVWTH
ncbi:MAG: hypothetical protein JNK16_00930 [Phycisphaerales bacterium]|nr:hypothetical protein [Phycisphaerales bacterium]